MLGAHFPELNTTFCHNNQQQQDVTNLSEAKTYHPATALYLYIVFASFLVALLSREQLLKTLLQTFWKVCKHNHFGVGGVFGMIGIGVNDAATGCTVGFAGATV